MLIAKRLGSSNGWPQSNIFVCMHVAQNEMYTDILCTLHNPHVAAWPIRMTSHPLPITLLDETLGRPTLGALARDILPPPLIPRA